MHEPPDLVYVVLGWKPGLPSQPASTLPSEVEAFDAGPRAQPGSLLRFSDSMPLAAAELLDIRVETVRAKRWALAHS